MLCESKRLKCFSNLFKLGTVLSRGGALFWGTLYSPPGSLRLGESLSQDTFQFWDFEFFRSA